MRAISFTLLVIPLVLAGPFTFPSHPSQRHVTLTAHDGRPLVLTVAQTITRTSTTMLIPPTLPESAGPRRTGRLGEEDLQLRDVFAPTGSSDSAVSASTSSASSYEDSVSEIASDSGSGESEAETSVVEQAAAARTTPAPPASDPDVAAALAEQGYSEATYYTCLTRDATYTHCGWHVPVVKVNAAAKSNGGRQRIEVIALGVACAIVVGDFIFGG